MFSLISCHKGALISGLSVTMSGILGDVCSVLALACFDVFAGICFDFSSIRAYNSNKLISNLVSDFNLRTSRSGRSCTQCTHPCTCRCQCCPVNCCSCGRNESVGPVHLPDDDLDTEQQSYIRSDQPKPHLAPESTVIPAVTTEGAT